jgi:hypothetical protein
MGHARRAMGATGSRGTTTHRAVGATASQQLQHCEQRVCGEEVLGRRITARHTNARASRSPSGTRTRLSWLRRDRQQGVAACIRTRARRADRLAPPAPSTALRSQRCSFLGSSGPARGRGEHHGDRAAGPEHAGGAYSAHLASRQTTKRRHRQSAGAVSDARRIGCAPPHALPVPKTRMVFEALPSWSWRMAAARPPRFKACFERGRGRPRSAASVVRHRLALWLSRRSVTEGCPLVHACAWRLGGTQHPVPP